MTFWKTVGAYLTGWVIAQSFYNRVICRGREEAWEREKVDLANRVVKAANAQAHLHQHCIEKSDREEFAELLFNVLVRRGEARPGQSSFEAAFRIAAKEYTEG